MLSRAYPMGYDWWVEQITEDETLVATAIELIEDDDGR
jgi:hypothetical protein